MLLRHLWWANRRSRCRRSTASFFCLPAFADNLNQHDRGWLSQAVLLHSSIEFPNTEIRELPARNKGGPYFELLENAEAITACDKSGSIVPSPRPLYIPCHQKCVSLTKKAMATQDGAPHGSVDDSMRHLWHVLKGLFDKASEEKFGPICNIYSAQAYGDIWRFHELVWQPSNDPDLRFDSIVNISPLLHVGSTDCFRHFEADHEDIPDMTNLILSHLQILPAAEPDSSSTEPSQLPQPKNLSLYYTAQSSSSE